MTEPSSFLHLFVLEYLGAIDTYSYLCVCVCVGVRNRNGSNVHFKIIYNWNKK